MIIWEVARKSPSTVVDQVLLYQQDFKDALFHPMLQGSASMVIAECTKERPDAFLSWLTDLIEVLKESEAMASFIPPIIANLGNFIKFSS
jgi:hypothetical protein